MRNYINFFSDNAIKSLKETFRTLNDTVQSVSMNDIGKAVDEAKTRMGNELKRFKQQIVNFVDRHTVEVPFDKKKDKLSYEIAGNIFTVNVNAINGTKQSNHVFELPSNVNISEMVQSYDSERKTMIFRFKKTDEEPVMKKSTARKKKSN